MSIDVIPYLNGQHEESKYYINWFDQKVDVLKIVDFIRSEEVKKSKRYVSVIKKQEFMYFLDRLFRLYGVQNIQNWESIYNENNDIISNKLDPNLAKRIKKHVNRIYRMNFSDQINAILKAEYRYLVDHVKYDKWTLQTIDVKKIAVREDQTIEQFTDVVAEKSKEIYQKYPFIKGVAIKHYDEKLNTEYKLIDGRSRCAACCEENKDEIDLVVNE